MKSGQTFWTKEELILAINLYSKISFGQMHNRNKEVIELAAIIDRSPSAIARKLGNFASFDPKLQERGVGGLPNTSKLDREVWNEYMHNWDELFIEGETILAQKKHTTIAQLNHIDLDNLPANEGKERETLVKVRVNQGLFRNIVLTNYNNTCCITGLNQPNLLVASHIVPWSQDTKNRLNPRNGLLLNPLHDKAFECGFLMITEDLKVKIAPSFLKQVNVEIIRQNFIDYDGRELLSAKKFSPDIEFLKMHSARFKS